MTSPCIKVCVMDLETQLCKGCYRTLAEIGRWSAMSEPEREAIMADLPGRRRSDVAKVSVPPLA